MEDYLRILGDGLSIGALAIIFSLSFSSHKRLEDPARPPLFFKRNGEPGPRVPKNAALWTMPVVSMLLLFLPTSVGATHRMVGDEAVMLVCLRAIVSAALALRHVVYIRGVLELMDQEGQLRP
jgi:hypothetical protein